MLFDTQQNKKNNYEDVTHELQIQYHSKYSLLYVYFIT